MNKIENVTIIGLGYVGISMMLLLSQKLNVIGIDTDKKKISSLKRGIPPINENEIKLLFSKHFKNLSFYNSFNRKIFRSDTYILCTPTDFNEKTGNFDTSILEKNISRILKNNKSANIVIKSTVPIGYTEKLHKNYKNNKIIFSPEFLREGNGLYDNLYPSRIIVGGKTEFARSFHNY